MDFAVRIRRRDNRTVTLTGLSAGELALLKEACAAPGPPPGPGFGFRSGELFITGTPAQVKQFCSFLRTRQNLPPYIPAQIEARLDNHLRRDHRVDLRCGTLDLGSRTHIMGVLNVTPDSFSDGGAFADAGQAVAHAREMAAAGADIIDIGGESTRPGSEPVPEEEELRRVIPVIEQVAAGVPVPVSIDTYKAPVARRALQAGASIVNDISGLRSSPDMAKVVADHGAAVVIMHIKGSPRDMQANPVYDDVVGEVLEYLEGGIEIALKAGIPRTRIMIDPGIGFGKTVEHNLTLIDRLDELLVLGFPIVLGTSRKRFIGTVLDIAEPALRTGGTAATVALGIRQGAHIVRVHDVAPMVQVARMTDAVIGSRTENN